MTCHEIEELLTLYVESQCSDEEAQIVAAHLSECEACRNKAAELSSLMSLLSQVPSVPVPEVFDSRLREALAREGAAIRRDGVFRKRNRVWKACAACAACFVVCFLIVSMTQNGGLPLPEDMVTSDRAPRESAAPAAAPMDAPAEAPAEAFVPESAEGDGAAVRFAAAAGAADDALASNEALKSADSVAPSQNAPVTTLSGRAPSATPSPNPDTSRRDAGGDLSDAAAAPAFDMPAAVYSEPEISTDEEGASGSSIPVPDRGSTLKNFAKAEVECDALLKSITNAINKRDSIALYNAMNMTAPQPSPEKTTSSALGEGPDIFTMAEASACMADLDAFFGEKQVTYERISGSLTVDGILYKIYNQKGEGISVEYEFQAEPSVQVVVRWINCGLAPEIIYEKTEGEPDEKTAGDN